METVIDHLLVSYERGALSRREIVGALAMLTTAAGSAAAAPAGFAGSSLNHVSITVSNIEHSVEFYGRVFALPPMGPNRTGATQLRVGKSHLTIRRGSPAGVVDHFAIGIERFNQESVSAELRARGAVPRNEEPYGLHVIDPYGVHVQVIDSEA